MSARGIINTFHIFKVFKVARIFDKILCMMLMGENIALNPTFCAGSVSGLGPEIYVSFRVAKFL